jgi:hypothetical protein
MCFLLAPLVGAQLFVRRQERVRGIYLHMALHDVFAPGVE